MSILKSIYKLAFFSITIAFISKSQALPCVMIADAGSSSTKFHLYSITPPDTPQQNPIENLLVTSKAPPITDALASDNPINYLSSLFESNLNSLSKNINTQNICNSTIPVFLYATAGVRSLNESEQINLMNDSRIAMSQTLQKINQSESRQWTLSDAEKDIQVLPGIKESLFGWMASNYAQGPLHSQNALARQTYMTSDMGGSSLEVAFASFRQKNTDANTSVFQNKQIYGYSYTNYGSTVVASQVPICYNPESMDTSGNYFSCYEGIIKYLQSQKDKNNGVKFITDSTAPSNINNLPMIGLSGYYYAAKNFATYLPDFNNEFYPVAHTEEDNTDSYQMSLKSWIYYSKELCSLPAFVISTNPLAPQLCVQATLGSIMMQRLGFIDDSLILASGTIHSLSTDWSLGAALQWGLTGYILI